MAQTKPVARAAVREQAQSSFLMAPPPGSEARALEQAWRRLALRLLGSIKQAPPVAIGVTSTIRGEGRTTGALALAISVATETQERVLLLGADFEGYGLAEALDTDDRRDLEGLLRGTWTPADAVADSGVPGVSVLPAYASEEGEHLSPHTLWPALRRALPALLEQFKREFPYVICDLPPLLDNADAPDIANAVDGVLLLTRAGVTPLPKLEEAAAFLPSAKILGTVHVGETSTLPKWVSTLLLE
ncbi:MAG: CpsD/CapB family tyrosine-protein kinase [Dehalococcoidia bacterium]